MMLRLVLDEVISLPIRPMLPASLAAPDDRAFLSLHTNLPLTLSASHCLPLAVLRALSVAIT